MFYCHLFDNCFSLKLSFFIAFKELYRSWTEVQVHVYALLSSLHQNEVTVTLTKDIILLEVGVDTLRELAFINVCFGYGSKLYSRFVLDLVNKVQHWLVGLSLLLMLGLAVEIVETPKCVVELFTFLSISHVRAQTLLTIGVLFTQFCQCVLSSIPQFLPTCHKF